MNSFFKLSSKQRHWFDFLMAMTEKEIKARYKHSVLSFLWMIINPLIQMVVIGFVFQFFVPVNVDNYFLFLFTGLLPWNFFSFSLNKTTSSIVSERSLIKKAKFSREIIVISVILSNMFHFLVSLVLLMIVLIGDKLIVESYSIINLSNYLFKFIGIFPLLIWLFILTSGLSLMLSALNVKYRDVGFLIRAILPLWFYATPIVYTLELLPSNIQPLFYLNPVTAIIENFHKILLGIPINNPKMVWISLIMTVFFSFVGWRIFNKESRFFDDWI